MPKPRKHLYVSPACWHGKHEECRLPASPDQPQACEYCQAPCLCGCHGPRFLRAHSEERSRGETERRRRKPG